MRTGASHRVPKRRKFSRSRVTGGNYWANRLHATRLLGHTYPVRRRKAHSR